jgi:hypothetical protein
MINKCEEYFRRKVMRSPSCKGVLLLLLLLLLLRHPKLLSSYEASCRKVKNKKPPQTIAETVILSAETDMVQKVFGEQCAQQLHNIPRSNNRICLWIADISEDLEEQLIEKLRQTFSIQIDEGTGCNGVGHLTAYVRHVEGNN